MILLDGKGRLIARPLPPQERASIEDKIAFLRARAEWSDRISDVANRAFDRQFRKAIKQ